MDLCVTLVLFFEQGALFPLLRLVRSLRAQTYGQWELLLVDAREKRPGGLKALLWAWALVEGRIRYSHSTDAWMDGVTGGYLCILREGDILHPSALFEAMCTIGRTGADLVYTDEAVYERTPGGRCYHCYKPDFSPDMLRGYNYIGCLLIYERALLEKAAPPILNHLTMREYDLCLRLTEKAARIVHVSKVLCFRQRSGGGLSADLLEDKAGIKEGRAALEGHLERRRMKGEVVPLPEGCFRIRYRIQGEPLVSILIPNRDNRDSLDKCLRSIRTRSTYTNYEILVLENNSTQNSTFKYYRSLAEDASVRVLYWEGDFNFALIVNFGVAHARGEHVIFLNNDTEVISPGWIEEMLMFSQRPDVGMTGALLYFPDDTVQHAGVTLGVGGIAGHNHKHFRRGEGGYLHRLRIAQNVSAVTAACSMMRRAVFEEVGGMDNAFGVAFNDVDLCMRLRRAGYLIVFTPHAELYHYESMSRGPEDGEEKRRRLAEETNRFRELWGQELEVGDPYYNPNLTLHSEDFSLRAFPRIRSPFERRLRAALRHWGCCGGSAPPSP